jgi:hypothetical protein
VDVRVIESSLIFVKLSIGEKCYSWGFMLHQQGWFGVILNLSYRLENNTVPFTLQALAGTSIKFLGKHSINHLIIEEVF